MTRHANAALATILLLAVSLLPACDVLNVPVGLGLGACGAFEGRLSQDPGAQVETARERCGANWDSFAFTVDDASTSVVFDPLVRNQDLHRAMLNTDVEIMLSDAIQVGDHTQGLTGRVTESVQGDAHLTPLTLGQFYIHDLWEDDDGGVIYFLAEWDLTFGDREGEGTFLHLTGEDWLVLDQALVL